MIRVVLPVGLRTLAGISGEVQLDVRGVITPQSILDELECDYPVLRGTIRDHQSHQRRPFIRFFACEQDFSHLPTDTALPEEVSSGREPFLIVGAIAGG